MPADHQDETPAGTQQTTETEAFLRRIDAVLHLLNITHEALLCVDEHCRVAAFNQGAEKLFGYKREQVLGMPVTYLVCRHYRVRQRHRLKVLSHIARESPIGFRTEGVICRRSNGERFPAEISLSHGLPPDRRFYTLVARDMSERVQQAEALAYKAGHDRLTNLPNRTLLYERLHAGMTRADRHGRKLGVIYMDLDQFKPVNDLYSHEAGDCLLQAVARRLNETMRRSDTVSRIGGHEFAIYLEQLKQPADAIAATRKIVEALMTPFQILGRQISVSASMGIALYPDHSRDTETLLRLADQAMYRAKAEGNSPGLYQPG